MWGAKVAIYPHPTMNRCTAFCENTDFMPIHDISAFALHDLRRIKFVSEEHLMDVFVIA